MSDRVGFGYPSRRSLRTLGAALVLIFAMLIASVGSARAASVPDRSSIVRSGTASTSTWKIQPSPRPANSDDEQFYGAACASPTACFAVGMNANHGPYQAAAERWNGKFWAVQSVPVPAAAFLSYLDGVECTSPVECIAVGYYENSSYVRFAMAEYWNGSAWNVQAIAQPKGTDGAALNSIACTSATACTAVGFLDIYHSSGDSQASMAERWNGARWTFQPTPDPPGYTGVGALSSVACPLVGACTAVGYSFDSTDHPVLFVEHWNGQSWLVQSTPDLQSADGSQLYGVTCTAPTACSAVGYYSTGSGGRFTLAEHWNGNTWTVQPTPNPAGAAGSTLAAAVCASATECTAVGYYRNSSNDRFTLAEHWNGTSWTVQSTPNSVGASGSYLDGLACTSPDVCTAAGYHENSGFYFPLVEAE